MYSEIRVLGHTSDLHIILGSHDISPEVTNDLWISGLIHCWFNWSLQDHTQTQSMVQLIKY